MEKKCPECGYPLNGNEAECPECGFIVNPQISNGSIDIDKWDYSQYRKGLFSQWYFKCDNLKHAESYDSLNDVLLLFNLIFRILWWIAWPIILIFILFAAFSLAIGHIAIFLGTITSIIVAICFTIPNAIHKFIVPLHRTWRRINKRYWISMDKAVKNNNPNIL